MRILQAIPILTIDDLDSTLNTYALATGMHDIMNHGWIATLAPEGSDSSVQISLITEEASAPIKPAVSIEVDNVDEEYKTAMGLAWRLSTNSGMRSGVFGVFSSETPPATSSMCCHISRLMRPHHMIPFHSTPRRSV